MKYILALDQGTTSSHASIIDSDGKFIASAQKEVSQYFPHPGWVEQNPEELWRTSLQVIYLALEKAKISSHDLSTIGIANQRETVILWNKKTKEPLTSAIVWQDRRTTDLCNYLISQGSDKLVRKKTGLTVDPYFSATKIQYLLKNSIELRRLAQQGILAFGTVDSWLVWKMTQGKIHITDVSNASRTALFNIHTLQWDKDLLALFGIPESILPKVISSSEVIGEAEIEGFAKSIPISAIAGDQSAALFGQMCIEPVSSKNTYGTGCFLLMNTGKKCQESEGQLLSTIAWQIGKEVEYALEGSIFIGGAVVQWLRDNLKFINDSSEVEQLALTVESSEGVYFVPSFTGLTVPHWNPAARGTILGLDRGTKPAHLARAALEGIAFQVSDLFEVLTKQSNHDIKELRVDGGACRNNLLMQFQADILNIPIIRPKQIETTSLGIGYLAGIGLGYWKSPQELKKHWEVDRIFEPNPSEKTRHQLQKWKKAVECVRLWNANE